ncbi:hypothetical protein SEA_FRANSOYER_85 [Microbacterium phage Fransoyer]|nr:hypothetical protein SEA_RUBYRALPH_85 [Microbacterium phage RubyRalph]UUG69650.1 hypothetical protein SEA_FRANSOYER_85 [Microbacterium phage Fransoyer]
MADQPTPIRERGDLTLESLKSGLREQWQCDVRNGRVHVELEYRSGIDRFVVTEHVSHTEEGTFAHTSTSFQTLGAARRAFRHAVNRHR